MGYLERIQNWKSLISSSYPQSLEKVQLGSLESSNPELFSVSSDLGADIEISFREVLATLLIPNSNISVITEDSDVFSLLKFAFAFAIQFQSLNLTQIPKLPFIMMEDIMECQTIERAESIWKIIESLTDTITNPDIFPKGKLTVLRMCNSLLRKLSKSCNTEFCGRVLMFLAAIYPLSEKSALNLSGKVNSNNLTYFESEEEYLRNAGCIRDGNNEMEIDNQPVDENNKSITEENPEDDNKSTLEENPEDGSKSTVVEGEQTGEPEIAYELYRAFWNLQSFFASDQKVSESAEAWEQFTGTARLVIQLLESTDFTDEELQQAHTLRQQHNGTGAGSNNTNPTGLSLPDESALAYSGCKYLTSSQLFSLQLKDPIVRQQVAVQLLYFIHYIRTKNSPFAPAELLAGVSKDMLFIHDKACRLIERSPNDGAELVAVVQRLLQRETRFIAWKGLACPEVEIPRLVLTEEELTARATFDLHKGSSHSFALYKKRIQRIKLKKPSSTTSTSAVSQSSLLSGYQFNYSDEHVKLVARELVKNIPSYEEEIQEYVDAEDPDAGIEEEYHPKKNNLYCWRARRLMAAQHLSAFSVMPDGDMGKGLRKILNLPEPSAESAEDGEAPAAGDDDGEGTDSAERAHRSASADGDSAEEEDQGGADEREMEEAGTAEDEEGVSAEAEASAAAEGAAEGMAAAGLLEDNEEDNLSSSETTVRRTGTGSSSSSKHQPNKKRKLANNTTAITEDGEEVEA